jgi:5-formyltetrahydrofolate cyclo-ligase
MYESKAALRAAALGQRNSLSTEKAESWGRSIQARVLETPFYRSANAIALYSSVQNEAATEELRDHSLHVGKRVFYPRLVSNRSLEFVEIKSVTELIPGKLGIPEPGGNNVLNHCGGEVDLLLIVPGVAFDQNGNRLGRGHAWYDRVIRQWGSRATPVGLAYEFQIVDRVPIDPWDQKVLFLFTQERFIDCQRVPEQTKQVC